MSAKPKAEETNGMRDEYDFSEGVRGKYADRMQGDTLLVKIDPDVASVFRPPRKSTGP